MSLPNIAQMSVEELSRLNPALAALLAQKDHAIQHRDLKIAQLTHEMATLKRWTFAKRSEQVEGLQRSLLEESIEEDLEAIAVELEQLTATPPDRPKGVPKRVALPKELPRIEIRHEPDTTTCSCGCALRRIGEDVREKLDYLPGVMQVERHIRGEWACERCETLIQASVPPQVIEKAFRRRACLRRCWSRNMPTTCRCIDRSRSTGAPAWRSRARRWPSGSGPAAPGSSRCARR
jgi:transposase